MPRTGLGFFPFARRYSGNNICFLFLWLLRCFTSPGSLSALQSLWYSNHRSCLIRKSPDQRLLRTSPKHIAAMPRPSSPLRAKASTIRPYVHWEHKKPSLKIWRLKLILFSTSITATYTSNYLRKIIYFVSVHRAYSDEKTSLATNSIMSSASRSVAQ